ncbi:hypothetical protein [Spirosoma endophyticum]|uniref:Uncharacterized protein n=1 Tax=Spirosoma endophyticum TaxID=662367 RepID=A0A1I2I961_9BACT|nr:hypothetical protein [Spirosoma endophyticum]SFF38130.1 hypothetical protein SAMN05216167_1595 [Spirosoma endophyticum]
MNKLIGLIALICLSLQCETQTAPEPESRVTVCGVNDPAKELPWLKDLIAKADEDKATLAYKGNYIGKIYLENFRDQPVFIVQMMMGSGGIAMYLFRCDGQRIMDVTDKEIATTIAGFERKNLVYANAP